MELELNDGTITVSRETISYFNVLQCAFEDDPEIGKLSFENISTETFNNLVRWIHGEEVIVDDDMINLVNFFNMIEPHKTRFCTEIMEYLLTEPKFLSKDFYIHLLKIAPERVVLFAEEYFSDEEKAYFRTFMTRPEDLGEDNEFNGKIIIYDDPIDFEILDDFLESNPDTWVYICDNLPQLTNAKNIIVDLPIIPDEFYTETNLANVIL